MPNGFHLILVNRQRTRSVNGRLFRRILTTWLAEELRLPHAQLVLHLVTSREIARLNESFLRHAGATDVITFDCSEPSARRNSAGRAIHGEIFICVDEAVGQARRFRATWQSELLRYAIHGVLHLLGYDDVSPPARQRMKRVEDRHLRRLARRFSLTKLARRRVLR
ncbi:MAG: rRNA maturation RNase YbeY [Verrucomicrobia bacterium]|nr:rRNA maturation RNase YbeY [Verrucomicrobiota bacterium]